MKLIEAKATKIICDAPTCDFKEKVEFNDFERFLNKPCPNCGENLLTEDDFERVKQVQSFVNLMNSFSKDQINEIKKVSGLELIPTDKPKSLVKVSTHKELKIDIDEN